MASAKKLYEIAKERYLEAVKKGVPEHLAFLAAQAEMLADVHTKKTKAAGPKPHLLYNAKDVYERLDKDCDEVVTRPLNPRLFAPLNGKLRIAEKDLRPDDIDVLVRWLKAGGMSWMKGGVTFKYIAREYIELVGRARKANVATTSLEDKL